MPKKDQFLDLMRCQETCELASEMYIQLNHVADEAANVKVFGNVSFWLNFLSNILHSIERNIFPASPFAYPLTVTFHFPSMTCHVLSNIFHFVSNIFHFVSNISHFEGNIFHSVSNIFPF